MRPNTPYGLHLDLKETDKLAAFVTQCKKDQKALELTNKAYKNCVEKPEIANSWWQKPNGAISAVLGALAVGFLLGASSK